MLKARETEYIITFKDNTKAYKEYNGEFIGNNIDETDDIFEEYKDQVYQYYEKRYILEDDIWKEDYVEVFYTSKGE